MNAASFLPLALAIGAEVIGTTALKASEGFTRIGPSLVTVLCYGTAFYCMSLAMRTVPVGIIYAVWSGAGIVLIAAIGAVMFGERLDGYAFLGLALILAGILVLNLLSGTARP